MSTGPTEGTRVALPPVASAAAPAASAPVPAPAPPPEPEPEEDLLRDVLDELDKERTKRAQVEADARKMAAEVKRLQTQLAQTQQAQQSKEQDESQIISRHAFAAMEAQVAGFQQIINALTLGKPAIAAAAKQQQQQQSQTNNIKRAHHAQGRRPPATLPLHVVRLLEVLPWDPRAAEHIFGKEVIYEWQIYDASGGSAHSGGSGRWHSNIRHFPSRLKQLPLFKAEGHAGGSGDHNNGGLLNFLAGEKALAAQPSKHGVLTDVRVHHVLKIEAGYPLPADGGQWEWVGGWRIEKRIKQPPTAGATVTTTEKQTVDCDDDGWSYAASVQDLEDLPTELAWDNPGPTYERKIRRRTWSRQRVLVDYPYASERTKQYLKLLAENARLTITATKISDQLVETKTKLTETEQALMELQSTKAAEVAKFTQELQHAQEESLTKSAAMAGGGSLGSATSSQHGKRIKVFLQKNEGPVKEIGSKISQWVASSRKTSEDFNDGGGSLDDALNDAAAAGPPKTEFASSASVGSIGSAGSLTGGGGSESGSFNWRKVGRGGLIEKLAGKKLPRGRSGSLNMDEEIIIDVVHEEEQDGASNKEEAAK
uniref:Uncharacterized protein n=1 Tax=Amphora coffeiformis TaxID=265554 RepID=A0A7S3LB97_9STRA